MNGDSFVQVDFKPLIQFHCNHRAMATIVVVRVPDAGRYGTVLVESDGRVVRFLEKCGESEPGVVNAGVYVFNRAILDYMPKGPASLEKDIFPSILSRGIYAVEHHGLFVDIGTPEDYARAEAMSEQLSRACYGQ
jgi:NDP-sugar pyrophosphorylase family protein